MRLDVPSQNRLTEARSHLKAGRHGSAIAIYQDLTSIITDNAGLWLEQALAAKDHADFPLAAASCREAARLAGHDGALLIRLGNEFRSLRRHAESRECFTRAMNDPAAAADAIRGLVDWHERTGDPDAARALVDDFLSGRPDDVTGRYLDSRLLERSGQPESAETTLRDLLGRDQTPPSVRISAGYLLARILDRTERFDEAMAVLEEVKAPMISDPRIRLGLSQYDEGVSARNRLLAQLTAPMIRNWQEAPLPAEANRPQIVFLGGHPRSGTTLLERVLDSHPGITAFDESPAFYLTVDPFLRTHGPGHPGVSSLPDAYFRQLEWELGTAIPTGCVLDKNPSLTACLHSWLRAFPGVRVLIALRHPLDVLLSCYFMDAPLNALSANFCSLERVAKHYRDMLDVWLRLRDLGGFRWLETRYEDLVRDVAGEGHRVTRFAGADWVPEQADFSQTRNSTPLAAPTFHDVTKPAHSRSINRWQAYERHLEPLRHKMRPYLDRLGYTW